MIPLSEVFSSATGVFDLTIWNRRRGGHAILFLGIDSSTGNALVVDPNAGKIERFEIAGPAADGTHSIKYGGEWWSVLGPGLRLDRGEMAARPAPEVVEPEAVSPEQYPAVPVFYDTRNPGAAEPVPQHLVEREFMANFIDRAGKYPAEMAGPQVYLPAERLGDERKAILSRLVSMARDRDSRMLLDAFALADADAKSAARHRALMRAGIEVGLWEVELETGQVVHSVFFTSHEASGIYIGDSNRVLASTMANLRRAEPKAVIRSLSYYHFHPSGSPLSPADVERPGLGFVHGVPLDVTFKIHAVVDVNGRLGVYRNTARGLRVTREEAEDGPNSYGFPR